MEKFQTELPNHFSLPRRINRLGELAYNLWWTWTPDAQRLFIKIDRDLWEQTYHNPIRFLNQVERARLNAETHDRYFLGFFDKTFQAYDEYLQSKDTWFSRQYPDYKDQTIAYFSMEFGLHETLPLYAGGLGVLSGDHLKEASDQGLPMVAVGFLYTKGYFSQRITEDGWQETREYTLDVDEAPLAPLVDADGEPLKISVELPKRTLTARLWEIRVGRVVAKLVVLD